MTDSPSTLLLDEEEFLALALHYLDGLATPQEKEDLEQVMTASAIFRDLYVQLNVQRSQLIEMPVAEIDERLIDEMPDADSVLLAITNNELSQRPSQDNKTDFRRTTMQSLKHWFKQPEVLAVWAATATLALGITLLATISFSTQPTNTPAPEQPEIVAADQVDQYLAAKYVATIVSTRNCVFKKDSLQLKPGMRITTGRVRLERGSFEIKYDSGVRATLRGPAELVIKSDNSSRLKLGKMVATVPQRAIGFAIETNLVKVIDQGTVFAVQIDLQGDVEVHVSKGYVELQPSGVHKILAKPDYLRAGQARRFTFRSKTRGAPIELAKDLFQQKNSMVKQFFPKGLVSYWNFDEQGGPAIDLRGTNDGQIKGGATRSTGLIGSGAIHFNQSNGRRVDVGPGYGSLDFSSAITIEVLLISGWRGNLKNNYDQILRKEDLGKRFLLSFQNDDYQVHSFPKSKPGPVLAFGLNVAGKYSELDMPLDGKQGRPSLADITDGKPHHIVATYDSKTGVKALYIDGTLRFSTKLKGNIVSGGDAMMLIGNSYSHSEPYRGVIDEVAIYKIALDSATIAKHYQRIRSGNNYYYTPEKKATDPSKVIDPSKSSNTKGLK